ncbi:unnamed protein product [Phaedon cochleariae]|uniref:Galectin n=1 Tax=Phaedon cochleariae TaxID=80249 RepID=A0A9N9SHN8_PHACE|nr:unnamed protein product [Phaedon cochleariae]
MIISSNFALPLQEQNMEAASDCLEYFEENKPKSDSLSFDLPDDLSAGLCINLHGIVTPDCTRFAIDLVCSKDANSDIALHINPRLSQKYIVRNSRIQGDWGDEEVTMVRKFNPFREKTIHLEILVAEKEFFVAVNGKHLFNFIFRIPVSKVKYLQIEGAVDITRLNYERSDIYPQKSLPDYIVGYNVTAEDCPPPQHTNIPLTAGLSEGFQNGCQLLLEGRVKLLPAEFTFNLQDGCHVWPRPKIYLHVNPRFRMSGECLLIKNAWIENFWGQEERTSQLDLPPGSKFSMMIQKDIGYFSIWLNGKLTGEFKFRGNVDRINSIYIQGDIDLHKLYMNSSQR